MVGPVDMIKQPEQQIEHHHRPRVADMREIVDRRPADVETHVIGIDGLEALLLAA